MLKSNQQLELAYNFVNYTNSNLFLTGKAGTGKTTFLKNLKNSSPKRMVVVAPTGVAAINAGGVTIHSFFQLPLGPQVQDMQHRMVLQKSAQHKEQKGFSGLPETKLTSSEPLTCWSLTKSVWYEPIYSML